MVPNTSTTHRRITNDELYERLQGMDGKIDSIISSHADFIKRFERHLGESEESQKNTNARLKGLEGKAWQVPMAIIAGLFGLLAAALSFMRK